MNIFKTNELVALSRIKVAVLFLFSSFWLGAQINTVSPLSIEGLGETTFGITPNFLGMAGTGIGYNDRYSINVLNPAGYSNLEYTTLEMSGAHRSFRHQILSEGIDQYNYNSYFDYFGFGFKFNEWFSGAVTLTPYAAKGYNVSVSDTSADFGLYEYRSVGSGGYDQLTVGMALAPVKWFSVGGNARYLFGEMISANKTILADTRYLCVSKTTKTGINDMMFDFGAQVKSDFGKYHAVAGAVYALGGDMNAREISTQYSFINSGIVETPVDTLYYNLATAGTLVLPSSFGFGVGLGQLVENVPVHAWDVVADYRRTNWNEFRTFGTSTTPGTQPITGVSERISAGFVFVPAYTLPKLERSINILAISRYRLGYSREVGQYQWQGMPYATREVNVGMSLPLIYRSLAPGEQKASFLNISMGVGQRWNGSDTYLKEDYWNFNLGITLNDKWFQKFRYR
jgi:hypothetical protein